MATHATLRDLSSYLDNELEAARRGRVELHLRDCTGCRERLAGLARAVERLERLEAEAPPLDLGAQVRRRTAVLAGARRRAAERWRRRLERLTGVPAVFPVLGVVLALAVIVYLFGLGVASREGGGPTLFVAEPSSGPEGGAALGGEAAGRRFRMVDGVWVEHGLGGAAAARVVRLDDEGLEPALRDELERLARLGGRVRFRYGGEVVELAPPPEP